MIFEHHETRQMTETEADLALENQVAEEAKRRIAEHGFSLLEILVVLAIMGLIAAFVGPRLFNQIDKSKQTVAETQARALTTALETMRLDIGRYPTLDEGLALLVERPADPQTANQWYGPYMDDGVPEDPWGNAYSYRPPLRDASGFEQKPFVYTLGADQQPGGTGLDRDLGRLPDNL